MKIFLDLDGVLVDFFTGVNKVFNIPKPPHRYDWFEDYDISREQLNNVCGMRFFSGLDWMFDGQEIEEVIRRKFGSGSIYLVTLPMPNSESWAGKVEWVNKHLSLYNKRLIITTAPKSLLAGPNSLLIDDKDENIAEFSMAGGQGILVPRLWNELHGWADEALQIVKNSLEAV
jgi:5'(3')-deoxyribonucleotidase